MKDFLRIQTIGQLHRMLGYEKPKHPLITVLDYSKFMPNPEHYSTSIVTDFYMISMKSPAPTSLLYGRQFYDFEEGTIMFVSPQQVFSVESFSENIKYEGWGIYFHPDLINKTHLAKKLKTYTFFS
jgi:AraC family transcriptional regulator, transcriptional activator of pobA